VTVLLPLLTLTSSCCPLNTLAVPVRMGVTLLTVALSSVMPPKPRLT
jgi:hypothetical protein